MRAGLTPDADGAFRERRERAVDAPAATTWTCVADLGGDPGWYAANRLWQVRGVLDRARTDDALTVVAGGTADDSEGYFVRPTVIEGTDPGHEVFTTEYFGPILAVHVYDDADYDAVLTQMESVAPYALTGAVIASDRAAIAHAQRFLRFAAGNFYVNDKPTGAVVGQQPFGGGRASGTNDKAGALQNLLRWTSTRSIKETFAPPTDHTYPHMS